MIAVASPVFWWLSWMEPGDDWRPVEWPLPTNVLAYWCTGADGDASAIVAIVRAPSEERAWEAVCEPGAWPAIGGQRRRFCRQIHGPPNHRFPPPDWSVKDGRWPWPIEVSE